MKKTLSLIGALLVFAGLKAQTTTVKKETAAPKPAAAVANNAGTKAWKVTDIKKQKDLKDTKAEKFSNPNLQKGAVDKAVPLKGANNANKQ